MKRTQTLVATGALTVVAAFAGGSLTSAVLSTGEARGAEQAVDEALAAAGMPEEPAGSSVDTCTLVTEPEAGAALGSDVTAIPNPAQCTYVATDGSARGVAVAVPDIPANKNELKAGVEQTANALEGSYRPIAAGDEGYAVISSMVSQGLAIGRNKLVVVVLTNPHGTADEQAGKLNQLLETAFGRL